MVSALVVLLLASPPFAQASDAPIRGALLVLPANLAGQSHDDMRAEVARLTEERHGLGGPAALVAVGFPLAVFGMIIGSLGLVPDCCNSSIQGFPIIVGGTFGVIGAAMFSVGAGWLVNRVIDRNENDRRRAELNKQIDELERLPPPVPPPAQISPPVAAPSIEPLPFPTRPAPAPRAKQPSK